MEGFQNWFELCNNFQEPERLLLFSGGFREIITSERFGKGCINLFASRSEAIVAEEIVLSRGLLLDGNVHYVGLGVDDAISFWLVDANLHLWLDDKVEKLQAGLIKIENPESSVEREYEFKQLDGEFEVERSRKSEYSGWVNCSAGNFTTSASHKREFENTVKFSNNGTEKTVEQEVKLKNKVRMVSYSGSSIVNLSFERKYPLKVTTTTLPGSAKDTSLMTTKLENSLEEKKQDGGYESEMKTTQKIRRVDVCDGS